MRRAFFFFLALIQHLQSCFKVEGDCDEEIYVDVKETDANGVAQCTFVKSDASSVRLAIFALFAVFIALMW